MTVRPNRRPIRSLEDLARVFDHWGSNLDELFHSYGLSTVAGVDKPAFVPALNVIEQETGFVISIEIPGVPKKNIKVTLSDGRLIISGKKDGEETTEGDEQCIQERLFGTFHRELALPSEVAGEETQVALKDGVLTIIIPKKPEQKPQVQEFNIG